MSEHVDQAEDETLVVKEGFIYEKTTNNYSRREGTEFFSVTETRLIDVQSTVTRKRAERYILHYDVMMAVLEEMVAFEYVTPSFFKKRKEILGTQLKALQKRMLEEESDLTDYQIELHKETYNSILLRIK